MSICYFSLSNINVGVLQSGKVLKIGAILIVNYHLTNGDLDRNQKFIIPYKTKLTRLEFHNPPKTSVFVGHVDLNEYLLYFY